MIVWGGGDDVSYFDTGGRYSPATDSWMPTSATNAPTARKYDTTVWSGNEMIIWGGAANSSRDTYNPVTNSWTATSVTNAPDARANHTAVWTGNEMIIWGGNDLVNFFNTGGRY